MSELRMRAMTQAEFDEYRRRSVRSYAGEHVRAGNWIAEDAEQHAEKETDELLPKGVDTPGMVLLVAEAAGAVVGLVWVGPAPRHRAGWWIYDIEVAEDQRGKGYGRALLDAAEREVVARDGDSVGLNVFGVNAVARGLYESAGYEVAALVMRKPLTP